ncbi:hypothetical protein ACYSNU_18365 [Enterococcus sp. LJL120]
MLANIADTVVKLDTELDKLDALNEDKDKKHEIKHILHEVGKYAKYDEDEMKKIDTYFENFND